MTVSKFTLKVRYELCTRVASMLADRLKPFKIRNHLLNFMSDLKMRMELPLM